jgi:hypothetical protein
MVSFQSSWCGFFEWINEVKRSPTPTPENDEEYEDREMNYEDKCRTRQRHRAKI